MGDKCTWVPDDGGYCIPSDCGAADGTSKNYCDMIRKDDSCVWYDSDSTCRIKTCDDDCLICASDTSCDASTFGDNGCYWDLSFCVPASCENKGPVCDN